MSARRRAPARHEWRSLHAQLPPLTGRRSRARGRPPRLANVSLDERVGRAAAAVVAMAGLIGLVLLLAGPTFRIRHVDVTGNRRLSAAQIVALAGLEEPGSVLMVDGRTIEGRLAGSSWIRSASVGAELPDRVRIRVDEWQPVALFRAAGGPGFYLSDQGVALGPAGDAGPPADVLPVDGPRQPAPRTGARALDPALLRALVNIQRGLPGLIGQEVRSFTIDGCGNVTLVSRRGWQAQFGRVLTPEELATLPDKVSALRTLAANGDVDYDSPTLRYVNVMNPALVAVGDRQQKPSPPLPAPCR